MYIIGNVAAVRETSSFSLLVSNDRRDDGEIVPTTGPPLCHDNGYETPEEESYPSYR